MSPSLLTFLLFSTSALQLIDSVLAAADAEFPLSGPSGLSVFVRKEGGHIRIFRNFTASKRGNGRTGEVTLYINDIKEYDTRNQTIEQKGVNLNSMTFSCNPVSNTYIPVGASLGSVKADCLNCETTLTLPGGRPTLQLTICAITQNGTLQLDDEISDAVAGQLKFSLKLSSWPWGGNGSYIELDVVFKIPPGRSLNKTRREARKPAKFSLGAGAYTEFSSKMFVDGLWKTMPAEYPKDWHNGANHILTLRIPRFNSSAIYDPTVEPGSDADSALSPYSDYVTPTTPHGAAAVPAAHIGLAVGVMTAILKLW